MQARSTTASARLRRTYSNRMFGRSAFDPFGPRMRHSSAKSCGRLVPTSNMGWNTTESRPGSRMRSRRVESVGTVYASAPDMPRRPRGLPRAVRGGITSESMRLSVFGRRSPRGGPSRAETADFPFSDTRGRAMSGEPLRVLLVEDEPGHAELARRAFEARAGDFVVSVAETVDAARAALHGASLARPGDRRLAAPGRGGARPPPQHAGPRDAADGDHDEPRERARGRRGDPRGRRGLPREERGGPGRPAAHRRAGRAAPAGRGGARRPRRRDGGRGRGGLLRRARAAPGEGAAGQVRLRGRARGRGHAADARPVRRRPPRGQRRVPARGHPVRRRPRRERLSHPRRRGRPLPGGRGAAADRGAELRGDRAARLDRRGPGHRQRHSRPAPRRGRAPRRRAAGLRREGGGGDRAAPGRARDRAAAGVRRQPPRHGGLAGHRRGPPRPDRPLQPGLRAGERVDGGGAAGPALLGRAAPRRGPPGGLPLLPGGQLRAGAARGLRVRVADALGRAPADLLDQPPRLRLDGRGDLRPRDRDRRHGPPAAGGRPAPRRVRVAGDLRRPAPRRRGGGRGGADRPRQPDGGRALGPGEVEGPHRRSARRSSGPASPGRPWASW